ncbi:MAG: hypothetical protein KU37_06065 [Sulfuricurvum sp. PC08-66]|nr:MAG: hypothetical protein KU37_06065 [Sulfuricurvum sp. PC08-66]
MRRIVWILIFLVGMLHAQGHKTLLGLDPSITIDSYAGLDVNIAPLVYQKPLNAFWDIRLSSILNYRPTLDDGYISGAGFDVGVPLHIRGSGVLKSNALHVGVGTGALRDFTHARTKINLWLELGLIQYGGTTDLWNNVWQIGASYSFWDDGRMSTFTHFGFKFIFGWWME